MVIAPEHEPRWKLAVHVDGSWSEIRGQRLTRGDKKEPIWEFILNPAPSVVMRYDLEDDLNSDGFIYRKYPTSLVRILSDDAHFGVYLILTDFEGEPMPEELYQKEKETQILNLQKIIGSHERVIAYLQNKLKMRSENILQSLEQDVKLIKTAAKARGKPEEEEGTEEPSTER